MPPAALLMPGSLNGEPGEELEFPGTVPPAASMSWQDWLGSPVPLGLPAASAGAAPATTKNPVRSPAVTAARMINLPGYRLGGRPRRLDTTSGFPHRFMIILVPECFGRDCAKAFGLLWSFMGERFG